MEITLDTKVQSIVLNSSLAAEHLKDMGFQLTPLNLRLTLGQLAEREDERPEEVLKELLAILEDE